MGAGRRSSLGEGQGDEGLWLWEAGGLSSPMTEPGVGTGGPGLGQGLWPEVLLHGKEQEVFWNTR